jgi:predicted methyltransferase
MRRLPLAFALAATLLSAATIAKEPVKAAAPATSATIAPLLAGEWRDPKNVARDKYRHPNETLTFFGITPTQTVIEIWPSSGWYAEILGPLLRAQGKYIGAVNDPAAATSDRGKANAERGNQALRDKFAARPEVYGPASLVLFDAAKPVFGAPGSADVVLTFRNVHNWRMAKQAEGMFAGFFAVLKPGGTLGVVEHRAAKDVPLDDESGYVGQAQVIAYATAAGFKLVGTSEVNANAKDSKDYPGGVWTLPPTLADGDKDREKYLAIGESDRMTLKFVKPKK